MSADVNPDAVKDCRPGFLGRLAQPRLQLEGELDRLGRLGEDDEERIPRRADLLALLEIGEHLPDQLMMRLNMGKALAIAQRLLQFGGTDDVREKKGEQADAVLALELLDPGAAVKCDL